MTLHVYGDIHKPANSMTNDLNIMPVVANILYYFVLTRP